MATSYDRFSIIIYQMYSLEFFLAFLAAGTVGVEAAAHVKLFVIMSPVGPYYKSGFKPIKLFADSRNRRAWPGGVGNAKVRAQTRKGTHNGTPFHLHDNCTII